MSTSVSYGGRTTRVDISRISDTDDPLINRVKELLSGKMNNVSIPYTKCKQAVDESLDGIPQFRNKTKDYKEEIEKISEKTKKTNAETYEVQSFNIPGHIAGLFTRMVNNRVASNNCQEYFVEIDTNFNVVINSLNSVYSNMEDIVHHSALLGEALQNSFPDLERKHKYSNKQGLGWAYFYLLVVNPSEIQSISTGSNDEDIDVLKLTQKILEDNPGIKNIFDDMYEAAGKIFQFFVEAIVFLATAAKDVALYLPKAAYSFVVSVSYSGTQYIEQLDQILRNLDEVEIRLKDVKCKLTSKEWEEITQYNISRQLYRLQL